MIKTINIQGYRSIRDLSLNLLPINVLTGPTVCGKSNLYNSLVLIACGAGFGHPCTDGGGQLRDTRRMTGGPVHSR